MPVQGPGLPKAQLQQLLNATLAKLDQDKIRYSTLSASIPPGPKGTDIFVLDFNIGEFPT